MTNLEWLRAQLLNELKDEEAALDAIERCFEFRSLTDTVSERFCHAAANGCTDCVPPIGACRACAHRWLREEA